MKIILSGLILFFIPAGFWAQSPAKLIFWSGDKNCGTKSRSVTDPGTVRCETIATDRGPVSSITYDGFSLAVAFLEEDEKLIVGAQITNSTSEIIGLDTDDWGVAHFKMRADFRTGVKPIAAETAIPTRDIIRSLAKGGKLENSLGEFVADNQMTAESRRIRRSDGTEYTRTTIVQDKAAKEAEVRQRTNRIENLTDEQRRIRNTALTNKFVPAHGSVKGLVYFRAVKKAEFVVYSLKVADTTFVFQLPREKR